MKTIELTQGQVALVDDVDYEYLSQWKWCLKRCKNHFCAGRTVHISGDKILRMHTAIAQRMGIDVKLIDHKDQNPLNNCRSNLRSATQSQNLHNHGANSNSSTGVKGVHFHKASGKYRARIQVQGREHSAGYFDTIPEAAFAIDKKRRELVGEFACA